MKRSINKIIKEFKNNKSFNFLFKLFTYIHEDETELLEFLQNCESYIKYNRDYNFSGYYKGSEYFQAFFYENSEEIKEFLQNYTENDINQIFNLWSEEGFLKVIDEIIFIAFNENGEEIKELISELEFITDTQNYKELDKIINKLDYYKRKGA